jgi:hypothetical protein
MHTIAAAVSRHRVEMTMDGERFSVGARSFLITPAMRAAGLIAQGRAPVAAHLIAHGAPPAFASAVSLVGWAAAWDVVERGTFEAAARWRMGRHTIAATRREPLVIEGEAERKEVRRASMLSLPSLISHTGAVPSHRPYIALREHAGRQPGRRGANPQGRAQFLRCFYLVSHGSPRIEAR